MVRNILVTWAVLCVVGVSLVSVVRAQSLGELAAHEAKRRAASTHAPKVITNADLPEAQVSADPPKPAADHAPAPPTPPASGHAVAPTPVGPPPHGHCLGDNKTSSKVSHPQPGIVVIDWVIDVANSCAEPHAIRAVYMVWGADDVLLQSDQQDLSIAAKARATAAGRMRLTAETWARVTHRSSVAQFR